MGVGARPLVLLMLGERSCEKYDKGMAKEGNLQFASGLLDCGCSSITLIDEEVFKKWRHHYGKMVRKVRWLKTPLVVNTAGDDKPLIVAMAEVYVVMCHETGTTEAGWVECDVMRGGNTGGCTAWCTGISRVESRNPTTPKNAENILHVPL